MRHCSKVRMAQPTHLFLGTLISVSIGVYILLLHTTQKQEGRGWSLVTSFLFSGTGIGSYTRGGKFWALRITAFALSGFLTVFFLVSTPVVSAAASPGKTENQASNEQLLSAARENDIQKVKRALERGANVNARTESGETVLHFVQDQGLAKLMIEKGADVNLRENDFKMTPIFFQKVAIAQFLYKAGGDINIRAVKGITPLMWYTYSNYLDGVKFLIINGAQVNSVNSEDSTALDIAIRFGHRELAEYLKSAGGKTAAELKN